MVVVPVTLFLILFLLYLNTRSITKTLIVLLAVPFSAVGAIWFLYLLGYNMSIGVWVGLIALLGVDAETGVFMLLYLDLAYEQAKKEGRLRISGRSAGSHPLRGGQAPPAKVHDRGHHVSRACPDHVVHRHRFRRHEADCRAHDRRNLYLLLTGIAGVSGHLSDLEMEF